MSPNIRHIFRKSQNGSPNDGLYLHVGDYTDYLNYLLEHKDTPPENLPGIEWIVVALLASIVKREDG